jgi:hypothetical protein
LKKYKLYLIIYCLTIIFGYSTIAQNPIVRDQYTADPSARVYNGKVYVFPSHDILVKEGVGRPGWFCMEDYHVFSSSDLTEWTDHGVIVNQINVQWADSKAFSMWAPDCIFRNNKYYFYFPTIIKDTSNGKGFFIGVAVADKPVGPYAPQSEPIKNARGIDPNVFIDKKGQAYLYWAMRNIYVAKLKENMLELASEPQIVKELPEKGLKEGPWLFERNGIYYMTYPHVQNKIERLEYATSDNPTGPFKFTGVIMDESPMNCWTNHQSILEYDGQWYLFYHQNALSPKFDKNRAICIDSLFFNTDGTIRKVMPTLRGVGITQAYAKIEIDRYSHISKEGASVALLDNVNSFLGWKTIFDTKEAWVQYNAVDFKNEIYKTVQVKAKSKLGGVLQIRLDNSLGTVISEVNIPANVDWNVVEANVLNIQPGLYNLVFLMKKSNPTEIDWVQFKK